MDEISSIILDVNSSEILLIDEVLGVGDYDFKEKSKIRLILLQLYLFWKII